MNSGISTGPVTFNEETQRHLFTRLTRKTAQAAGIQALATVAISDGDLLALERIAALAAELVEGLDELTHMTGQFTQVIAH